MMKAISSALTLLALIAVAAPAEAAGAVCLSTRILEHQGGKWRHRRRVPDA